LLFRFVLHRVSKQEVTLSLG